MAANLASGENQKALAAMDKIEKELWSKALS